MVVATILERNPELNFDGLLDLDEVCAIIMLQRWS